MIFMYINDVFIEAANI